MKIIGGMAMPKGVNITSENFSVVAKLHSNGEISHTTTPTSEAEKWLRKAKYMPKVLKMFLFIIMKLTPKGRLILLAFIIGAPLLLSATVKPEQSDALAPEVTIAIRVITFGIFFYLLLSVRGFHAAEHMAIAAYERHGVKGIDRLSEQDRVHNKCGGRMLFPLLIVFGCSQLTAAFYDYWWVPLLPFILFEIVLWVDAIVGYDKIFVTQVISVWLQRTITTKPPSEQELQTGRYALRQLLIAEGEIATNECVK